MSNEDDRDPVEVLGEEFLELRRQGDAVSIEHYEERYPELAADIREVFPAILAMETAKPRQVIAPPLASFDAVARGEIRQLGDFRIIRKIAHGGMGVVYEAEEISLERKVAIKILSTNLINDRSVLERFQREAKTIARLHHTNIVSVFGSGVDNDLYFFVMEFIDGKSLDRLIRSGEFKKKLANDWFWIADVGKRVALALRHAHEKSVLHRDVKPGNILIDSDRKPWITDFGLAKFDEHDDLTRPGDAVGTLRYMAPEQLDGKADERSDVFGLGLVLYEMLTGQKAYGDSESQNLLERITNRDLPAPSKLNPAIPLDLEMITLKAISVDPDDRYQRAVDLAEDLDRWSNDLPIKARPLTAMQNLVRWSKRNPLVAGLSSTVVVLFVVLLISFAVIAFAWLGEHTARLEAKIAQKHEAESRAEAEASVSRAIPLMDRLATDLGLINRIKDGQDVDESYLFSPRGGMPVSESTKQQLALLLDFYQSIGSWSNQELEIQVKRTKAVFRSVEILLQLGEFDRAKQELIGIVHEFRNATHSNLVMFHLHANYLIGYAELLQKDLDAAEACFEAQLNLIEEIQLKPDQERLEKGMVHLALGAVEHERGRIDRWFHSINRAIDLFEQLVDWNDASSHPVAAMFLARSYLNAPPHYRAPRYPQLFQRRQSRAVSVFHQLYQLQLESSLNSTRAPVTLFLFEYCDCVSMLPSEVKQVELARGVVVNANQLLTDAIDSCSKVLKTSPEHSAFRFALSRCQMNLASRQPERFDEYSQEAIENLDRLVDRYPQDPRFRTERGEVFYRIGRKSLASRDFKHAKNALLKSVDDLKTSYRVSKSYPKTKRYLGLVHEYLAMAYDGLDDKTNGDYYRTQQELYEGLFPPPPGPAPRARGPKMLPGILNFLGGPKKGRR